MVYWEILGCILIQTCTIRAVFTDAKGHASVLISASRVRCVSVGLNGRSSEPADGIERRELAGADATGTRVIVGRLVLPELSEHFPGVRE